MTAMHLFFGDFMTFARRLYRPVLFCLTCILAASITLNAAPSNSQRLQQGGKKQIEQLKKLKLIEALNLDDATAQKFFVRYNTEQKKVDEARKALDDAMNDLEKAKSSGNGDKIKLSTQQTLDRHKQVQDASNEMLRSIREVLNDKQYADFLVFEAKFQEQITPLDMVVPQ
jgi:hypothetical protein